ncbi:MAG: hypothetical protein F9K29_21005 [Hyphomicrobiaceae bacterium]|nr:MAG: hypothetical protein F9K29_21005 [Hyphomicrobiaceae bacterium]
MTHEDGDQVRGSRDDMKSRASEFGIVPALLAAVFVALLLLLIFSPRGDTPAGSRQSGIQQDRPATSPAPATPPSPTTK